MCACMCMRVRVCTVSLGQVGGGMQVGPAHVVAVTLRSDTPLLGALLCGWGHGGGRGPIGANGRVLVHDAAEGPARAGVL